MRGLEELWSRRGGEMGRNSAVRFKPVLQFSARPMIQVELSAPLSASDTKPFVILGCKLTE